MPNEAQNQEAREPGATGQPDATAPEQQYPKAPPPPKICNGCNIFDGLFTGSLLLFFCMMSWTHGSNAFGRYAFFRGGTTSGTLLTMFTLVSAAAVGMGLTIAYMRIRHRRWCKLHYPKPPKKKGPGLFDDMSDAFEQLLGLKPYEGLNKEEARAAPVKKRYLRDWVRHEKFRLGLSTLMFFILMYLTPGFIMHLMGQHVILYFVLEFSMVMCTFVMWLIAWVELGE